ncbi:uncharacterized protein DSM5745_04480 [Aspergillus mulundensis]|uniref:Uncharacterized protein n=1 Tax=Aspergillus mulundensis TaxID=1810919 RepID=A0A3D8SDH8_9EURO|nr:hypothetical protein DSM5745_04480 [Aspergillus mulundensis]RDW84154.1 hypothetical protein DSM5745_04480 [Aspergillus mulundensis]
MTPSAIPSPPGGTNLIKQEPVKEERSENSLWDVPAENPTTRRITKTEDIDNPEAILNIVKEEAFDTSKFLDELPVLMQGIQSTGSFCLTNTTEFVINPGLEVTGVGQIGLPLSPDAAEAIASVGTPLPPHDGLSDHSHAAATHELRPEQLGFRNSKWEVQMGMIVTEVLKGFGLSSDLDDVKVELDQCLLSKEGAFSLPKPDRGEVAGKFGTLALFLPSRHVGGDITYSTITETKVFALRDAEFDFSYAAWASFTTYEEKPISSGHRLVLVYNLIHEASQTCLLERKSQFAELQKCLESWARWAERKTSSLDTDSPLLPSQWPTHVLPLNSPGEAGDGLPVILYQLDGSNLDDYAVRWAEIQGPNQVLLAEMQRVCDVSNCRAYLGSLVIRQYLTDHGQVDGNRRLVRSVDFTCNLVHGPDGKIVVDQLKINPRMCASTLSLPQEPTYEERRGSLTIQTYYRTVTVIIPNAFYFPLLLEALQRSHVQVKLLLEELSRAYRASPADPKLRSQTNELCQLILADPIWSKRYPEEVARLGLEMDDATIVKQCLDILEEKVENLAKDFGKAITIRGVDHMRPVLDHIWTLRSSSAVGHLSMLEQMRSPWSEISRSGNYSFEQALTWYKATRDMLFTRLEERTMLQHADGKLLARTVPCFDKIFTKTRVVAMVGKNVRSPGFSVSFVTSLFGNYDKANCLDLDKILPVYRGLIPDVLKEFEIMAHRPAPRPFIYIPPRSWKAEDFVRPHSVVRLIDQCLRIDQDVSGLLDKIEKQVNYRLNGSSTGVFSQFVCQFVTSSADVLQRRLQNQPPTDTNNVQHQWSGLIFRLLESCLLRCTGGPYPTSHTDWSQHLPGEDCCFDCEDLRRFVQDPYKQTEEFRIAQGRRSHLQARLPKTFVCETIRDGSPHVLRVIKTEAGFIHAIDFWKEGAKIGRDRLELIAKRCPLKDVIGEERYKELEVYVTKPNALATNSTPVSNQAMTALNPIDANRRSRDGPRSPTSAPTPTIPQKRSYLKLEDD